MLSFLLHLHKQCMFLMEDVKCSNVETIYYIYDSINPATCSILVESSYLILLDVLICSDQHRDTCLYQVTQPVKAD